MASEVVAKKAVDGETGEAWPKLQGLTKDPGQAFCFLFFTVFPLVNFGTID